MPYPCNYCGHVDLYHNKHRSGRCSVYDCMCQGFSPLLSQLAEEPDLKSGKSQFESEAGDHTTPEMVDKISGTINDLKKTLRSKENPGASTKFDRIAFLCRKMLAVKVDLMMKYEDSDFHGGQDAASDLRDIESELKGLKF